MKPIARRTGGGFFIFGDDPYDDQYNKNEYA
jgi:hypothetical protein